MAFSDSTNYDRANYDIKKVRREFYSARSTFQVLDVPNQRFLMADGSGDPNTSPDYSAAVEALYTTSYALRAVWKERTGRTFTVGPLEGLWSAPDLAAFTDRDKDAWEWTLMIVQPDWVDEPLLGDAHSRMTKQGRRPSDRVKLADFAEGLSVQILHVGPYDAEAPTIATLHQEFLPAQRLSPRGRHHEIYLSDARRTHPSRLRTILRQPVSRQSPTAG